MRTLVALTLLLLSVQARAEVFTIPLPALHGTYPYLSSPTQSGRDAGFSLPGKPAVVRGATLHLIGTAEVGTLMCEDGTGSPAPRPWNTETLGTMEDFAFFAENVNPEVAGPFDSTVPFRAMPAGEIATSIPALLDGEGSVHLDAAPLMYVLFCSQSDPPPTVTVTGAWIQVDADIPVPAATTSWGALKAIYR